MILEPNKIYELDAGVKNIFCRGGEASIFLGSNSSELTLDIVLNLDDNAYFTSTTGLKIKYETGDNAILEIL